MPTFVDELPTRERTRKYNFVQFYKDMLSSGQGLKLVNGEDFDCDVASIKQYIYADARKNGLKASVYAEGEDVVFTVRYPESKDESDEDGGQE